MKRAFYLIVPILLASSLMVLAQGKSSKPERKTMIFQPGAKTPEGTPPTAPAVPAVPATPSGVDEPGQAAAAFFVLLQRGLIDEAYTNLTKGSKIGERPEELQTLKAKTNEAIQVFGAVQGYELIETKAVGANLMRRTYLSLGRDFPLRWRFYYYRSGGYWRLVDLRVDDRLAGMFDEQEEPRTVGAAPAEPKAP